MTEIKNQTQYAGDQQEPVTVETAKVIQGMSLIFAGAVTMLEALHPHVSLAPSAILDLVTGNVTGLEEAAAARRAMKVGKEAAANDAEETGGTVDPAPAPAVSAAAPVDDSPEDDSSMNNSDAKDVNSEPAADPSAQSAPGITVDDVARIVVQKVKANPGINEKIRALVKAHGAERVTELKPEVLEAFLTDLSQL